MDTKRKGMLHWFFKQVLKGEHDVYTCPKAKRFLESICSETDHVACVESIISSSNGIAALQQAVRIETTASFVNVSVGNILRYLQHPAVAAACGGDLLHSILQHMVVPPIFWNSFCHHVEAQALDPATLQCFAWMLLQLVSLPQLDTKSFVQTASDPKIKHILENATEPETRNLFQKIQRVVSTLNIGFADAMNGPGGRHNNDFEDFRRIALLPTIDELMTAETAFLRLANEIEDVAEEQRLATHLDNQFRLLREDMLSELKQEMTGQNKQKRQKVDHLHLIGVTYSEHRKWALEFECAKGLHFMPKKSDAASREDFLKKHKKILAHGALACLFVNDSAVGFGIISRREDRLAEHIPVLALHLPPNDSTIRQILRSLRPGTRISILPLNTAVFAYEPILRQLQEARDLPLAEHFMNWCQSRETLKVDIPAKLQDLVSKLVHEPSMELCHVLSLEKSVKLDDSQAASFVTGLTQALAIIQGPPGTGKSFIGALVAKALYHCTSLKMLVISYTNHALNQYLEDLINVGIAQTHITRLGPVSKASDATKPLVLTEQIRAKAAYKLTRNDWDLFDTYKSEALDTGTRLTSAFDELAQSNATKQAVMDYLEFSGEYEDYFDAFQMPNDDRFTVVDDKGKAAHKFYLLDRWLRNKGPSDAIEQTEDYQDVWSMSNEQREILRTKWLNTIFEARLNRVIEYGLLYDKQISTAHTVKGEGGRRLMKDARIIGCTTTAAAKYVKDIQAAQPDVVIVEEAGEILESHILAALGPQTKQLILIGDHKQLRPKAHYDLSVEKGTGYDLNRSLFERLVLKGYPHQTLSQQHRMRPEISRFVRALTYPDLTDADSTKQRACIRGFQDNVVFYTHNTLEYEGPQIYDPREGGSSASKTNEHEVRMTVKCVKYIAQQGYRSDQIVVLTPYLGQLRLLYDEVQKENDPVLNDLDSYDLVQAGLMPPGTAKSKRTQLRISTIDNYQGEESDIVLVSLTRSNKRGDIGFMSSSQRLNVLISRARDGIILIGNADTFLNARKGKEVWTAFISMLQEGHHVYDGLPIRCEIHKERTAVLKKPEDFDLLCPDGGCDAPCSTTLSCGTHTCPSKCHQLHDHSKMKCNKVMASTCSIGHKLSWKCHEQSPAACRVCASARRRDEENKSKVHDRMVAEALSQLDHEAKMAKLDAQIEAERHKVKQMRIQDDRSHAHQMKLKDLQQAREAANRADQTTTSPSLLSKSANTESSNRPRGAPKPATTNAEQKSTTVVHEKSDSLACDTWEDMKSTDGVKSEALDELMQMTGLETVKGRFLEILQRIQTAHRQNIDIKQERLGAVLLGNPGTGKTTVARIYAKFLAEVGAISSHKLYETTGAKLANEGVPEAKKMITDMLEAGGGAVLIDEAYQLVSGNSYGGGAVLDYLLPEIENTTGKIVFMFAGYDRQMEKFFEHNLGLASRMPHQLKFTDYAEAELLTMLRRKISKRYQGRMQIEDGPSGLYMRILVRRLHRTSGQEGFGNARALENVLDRVLSTQAVRLARERRARLNTDDLLLTRHDLIGPEPSEALRNSTAWSKLQKMVGLGVVKSSVEVMLQRLSSNYARELNEKPPVEVSLNRLFLGPPGTGKTTVAKLYGQILADIGLLSTSECIFKTPSDFIGSVLGESERNTKAILQIAKGKVLVLDEAYMLCSTSGTADPYRTAVIDTIVSEVHNTPGDDRAVILLGYEDEMKEMLRKTNPGLSRRFPIESAFVFHDFNDNELLSILQYKLSLQGLTATEDAKNTAIDVLAKLRRRPNFGNAGEVENLLSRAKENHARRPKTQEEEQNNDEIVLMPHDFDPDFGKSGNALQNCKNLFTDVVGHEVLMEKLTGYIQSFQNAKQIGLNPAETIPFNFVFKGPPGTGKTTTARKIGTVFCDMGFLGRANVIECSATDLVGQYVGQTGPKVVAKFEEALGQVLFIDEAYRLGQGPFSKEAVDEVVDCLTKERYKGRMLVILAGYEGEINDLLRVNPGLSSRFPEEIMFQALTPRLALDLLIKNLHKHNKLRLSFNSGREERILAENIVSQLSQLSGWGNGRDIDTLASRTVAEVLKTSEPTDGKLDVAWPDVIAQLTRLYNERSQRDARPSVKPPSAWLEQPQMQLRDRPLSAEPRASPAIVSTTAPPAQPEPELQDAIKEQVKSVQDSSLRDDGVSDATWQQLQLDQALQTQEQIRLATAIKDGEAQKDALTKDAHRAAEAAEVATKQTAVDDEARRRFELIRLKAVRMKREADEEALRVQRLLEQQRQEQKIQEKLRYMGVCPVGFRWIKQSNGYRCAGGSHFIDNGALGL